VSKDKSSDDSSLLSAASAAAIEALRFTNNWFNYQSFYDYIASISHFNTFVEIGVWKGHSISYLARQLRNRNVRIYAVDLFEDSNQFP